MSVASAIKPSTQVTFPNAASEFVYVRTYARWLDHAGRRECWEETVQRYHDYMFSKFGESIPPKVYRSIKKAMLLFGVMPSMRALWAAGPAADADNVCMYNCSYQAIDKIEAFSECLHILMCGAGYGFSVENKYISKLPIVKVSKQLQMNQTVKVEDSRTGWANSVHLLISQLYEGYNIDFDYSEVRPKGARLITMGGRSSGPEPLICLHAFIREVFTGAQGRQLTSLECHDIINEIGQVVVAGGVRRSSEMSLSDLDDQQMANAKQWPFPSRRYMANNSAVYNEKPNAVDFLKEWSILAASGTGERGIFNRYTTQNRAPSRRKLKDLIVGTNPCGEISLRSEQFCNLSEIVLREEDDMDLLLKKAETATWMGVLQSTFTNFSYLNDNWKRNCEEERLIGVSITGQMDHPRMLTPVALEAIKLKVIKTAKHAAKILGINVPAAATCVKPSGTTSQVVNSSSGMHARYSKYQIRRYRISGTDPLFCMMRDIGMPVSPENGESEEDWAKAAEVFTAGHHNSKDICPIFDSNKAWSEELVRTWVLSFPVKAPESCITRDNMNAIEQLEYYKKLQENWCEHNASCTVYVRDHEWFNVGNWVLNNWSYVSGIAFLPHNGGHYQQAPNEEISKEQYEAMVEALPDIDYGLLGSYEHTDNTEGAKVYACTGDKCDLT